MTEREDLGGRTEGRVSQRSRRSMFADRITLPMADRIRIDETSGWPVIIASLVALLWANVMPGSYGAVWETGISVQLGEWGLDLTLRDAIDTLLLPIFFFVIGLEIREEFASGRLSRKRHAALPLLAAAGGMLVPIALYMAVAWDSPHRGGFGVPVATDIAFALALLMVLGDRVPAALKAFLLAFAAMDDVGGVLVIAVFYGHGLSLPWLVAAIAVTALSYWVFRLRPQSVWVYASLGFLLWATTAISGIHVTIAGAAFGLLIPRRPLYRAREVADRAGRLAESLETATGEGADRDRLLGRLEELAARSESPAEMLARHLNPVVSYVVLPLFGLALAGTSLSADAWADLPGHTGALGIVTGLLIGKPLGVFGFSWLGARLGIAALPSGLDWGHVLGASALASIGFTVSLFIAKLGFPPADLAVVKLAILFSSCVGAATGLTILFSKTSHVGV